MRTPSMLAAVLIIASGCGNGTDTASSSPTPAAPAATPGTIRIEAHDPFSFEPSTLRVEPGSYTIEFVNTGATEHQFALSEKGEHGAEAHTIGDTGRIAAGSSKTVTIELMEGEYDYACHVEGHFENGMKGTLTVG